MKGVNDTLSQQSKERDHSKDASDGGRGLASDLHQVGVVYCFYEPYQNPGKSELDASPPVQGSRTLPLNG